MDCVGLKGDRVRLRRLDRTLHLENALRWMNDPEVTATNERNFGVSRKEEESFFDMAENPGETAIYWAIHDEADAHVGFIDFHQVSWRHRLAIGGLVIGDRSAWGKGYATDAVRSRTKFAFEQMGLHRVEGHTICPAMRRVYEKCGYAHEGTWREKIWRDGRWRDAHLYAILEQDVTHLDESAGPTPTMEAVERFGELGPRLGPK